VPAGALQTAKTDLADRTAVGDLFHPRPFAQPIAEYEHSVDPLAGQPHRQLPSERIGDRDSRGCIGCEARNRSAGDALAKTVILTRIGRGVEQQALSLYGGLTEPQRAEVRL